MPLTLKDIAKMVGVAESTVSRAINNKPGVGQATKEKIMKIVKEYDYQPNQLARGLARQETCILALLLADLENTSYIQIIRSVERVAESSGYQLVLCNTDHNPEKEKAYLELVAKKRVDGAILVGGDLADKNVLKLALNKKDLLVLVNQLAEEYLIPTVLIDSRQGGYLATKHLLEQGLERIAIIMSNPEDYLESEKLAGYQEALEEKGIPLRQEFVFTTDGSRRDGYETFLGLMGVEELPQGFFVTNDLLAAGLVEAIKMGGYLIPEDFSIVAYGDSILTSLISPPLTVVAEPLTEVGRYAAEYLIQLLQGKPPGELIKVLEPELKIRESSSRIINN